MKKYEFGEKEDRIHLNNLANKLFPIIEQMLVSLSDTQTESAT